MATTVDPRTRRTVAAVLLALLAVGFLALSWSRITMVFGDSDEGINGAVWGADSRSLRELGIADSRFGGLRADGTKYANHPPLLVAEAAAVESVAGEHPWSTRAGAWLGALATIPLLYLLLRTLKVDELVAAAATVAALAGHMWLVYGVMLDTMIIAFPFALGVLIVWHRQWTGQRTPSGAAVFGLAALASLGGWQAVVLCGMCGVAAFFRPPPPHAPDQLPAEEPGRVNRALPYLLGALVAVVVTMAWARWTYGSLDPLLDKFTKRSGESSSVGMLDMISFQLPWLGQLLGLGLFAWIACAVSIRDRRFAGLATLSLASVILYALLFRDGSGGHQYWNYWGLLPAAVGFAYVFDAVATALRRRKVSANGRIAVLVAAALVVAGLNLSQPDQAGELIVAGAAPVELVTAARFPDGQTTLPYVAEPYRADDWLRYNRLPAGDPLLDADELRTLARDHPDHLVLLLGTCARPDPTGICRPLTFGADPTAETVPPRLETAAALAARLPG